MPSRQHSGPLILQRGVVTRLVRVPLTERSLSRPVGERGIYFQ